MTKLIIFTPNDNHFWESLNFISKKIFEILSHSHLSIEFIKIENNSLTEEQVLKLKKMSINTPISLYFLHDNLSLEVICSQLSALQIQKYIFPIYGNLTLELERWTRLEKILLGRPVTLLAASHRSFEQVRRLTMNADIKLIPYPVELEYKNQSTSDSKLKIIYAGRIAVEKNVLDLLHAFSEALKYRSDIELHIAGDFHPKYFKAHGVKLDLERLKDQCKEYASTYPQNIFFHGQLSQNDLLELYSKMDVFISCSTHHDEDFGISAAQAELMGLDLILSDWGGHNDFKSAKFIPIIVNERNIPQIDPIYLFKIILSLTKNEKSPPDKETVLRTSGSEFLKRFEEVLVSPQLPFQGLSPLFHTLAEVSKTDFPYSSNRKGSRELYLAIYGSYLGK